MLLRYPLPIQGWRNKGHEYYEGLYVQEGTNNYILAAVSGHALQNHAMSGKRIYKQDSQILDQAPDGLSHFCKYFTEQTDYAHPVIKQVAGTECDKKNNSDNPAQPKRQGLPDIGKKKHFYNFSFRGFRQDDLHF